MGLSEKKRKKYERKLPKAKQRQSKLSRAAGLGAMAGAGGLATSAIIRKPGLIKPSNFPKHIERIKNIKLRAPDLSDPAKRTAYADKLKDKSFVVGSSAGAVGGLAGLNFAGIQRKEAKLAKK